MATAETVMAVYSEEHETLESRIRPKDLCPVWREGWRNLPQQRGKALHPYSTARPDLCGGCPAMGIPTAIRVPNDTVTKYVAGT
jgi:hypothetical protein